MLLQTLAWKEEGGFHRDTVLRLGQGLWRTLTAREERIHSPAPGFVFLSLVHVRIFIPICI